MEVDDDGLVENPPHPGIIDLGGEQEEQER
jgi:hypothetical protein